MDDHRAKHSMGLKTKNDQRTGARRRRAGPKGKNFVYVLRQDLGVSQEVMARLLAISLRTLSRLEGSIEPPKPPRAFGELSRLTEGLLSIIRKESLGSWIDRPNEAFGGLKPIEVIERGEVDRIWKMIHQVGSGQPV
jgi:DNA-binding transcriptional regulator YiaG